MKTVVITDIPNETEQRLTTGISLFDNFLGGGFVRSQCIMLAGSPGAGKSTMLLQLSQKLAAKGVKILYISGEENLGQIKLRANRLRTLNPNIVCTNDVELGSIYKAIKQLDPQFIILDSIQTLYSDKIDKPKGSQTQIKESFLELTDYIKTTDKTLVAIGHANKNGEVGGVLTLQHMVDTVLFINVERDKETHVVTRFIKAIKNRFGAIEEEFPLTMTSLGFSQLNNNVLQFELKETKPEESFSTKLKRFFMLYIAFNLSATPRGRRILNPYLRTIKHHPALQYQISRN